MAQREVVFEMENGKDSGVDRIVLYLGEGVDARLKNKKAGKTKKDRKAKRLKRKGKINVTEIEIFAEENEEVKCKVEVAIMIEKELSYKFTFKIEEGLDFITIGECRGGILARASKPEET